MSDDVHLDDLGEVVDRELAAMAAIVRALQALSPAQRGRVLEWAAEVYDLVPT